MSVVQAETCPLGFTGVAVLSRGTNRMRTCRDCPFFHSNQKQNSSHAIVWLISLIWIFGRIRCLLINSRGLAGISNYQDFVLFYRVCVCVCYVSKSVRSHLNFVLVSYFVLKMHNLSASPVDYLKPSVQERPRKWQITELSSSNLMLLPASFVVPNLKGYIYIKQESVSYRGKPFVICS